MQKQLLSVFALFAFALVCAGSASALVQRTFVSGLGSDANDCSRAAPCRTFGAAIAQTLAGGEVLALDTAGYGPVTITKAISLISPPGVYAGISTTVAGANAITVNAGANDVVVLKGLSLSGLGVGDVGVQFDSGKTLRVEGLTISGFGNGILFTPTVSARLTVIDSLLRDNGSNGIYTIAPAGQVARVTIDRTRIVGAFNGLGADANSRVTVRDSVATGNTQVGFYAEAATTVLNLENCLATDNQYGIFSFGITRVAGTTITENGTGVVGTVFSRGNNTLEGNTSDGTFTALFAAK